MKRWITREYTSLGASSLAPTTYVAHATKAAAVQWARGRSLFNLECRVLLYAACDPLWRAEFKQGLVNDSNDSSLPFEPTTVELLKLLERQNERFFRVPLKEQLIQPGHVAPVIPFKRRGAVLCSK